MARYRKVDVRVWRDEFVERLSNEGKLVWMYLLTSPQSNQIGLYVFSPDRACADLRWTPKDFAEAFGEAFAKGWSKGAERSPLLWDEKAGVIYLRNFIKYNRPESPNVIRSWRDVFDELPERTPLKNTWKIEVSQIVDGYSDSFRKVWSKAFGKDFREDYQEDLWKDLGEGSPSGTGTGTGSPPISPTGGHPEVCVSLVPGNGGSGKGAVPASGDSPPEAQGFPLEAHGEIGTPPPPPVAPPPPPPVPADFEGAIREAFRSSYDARYGHPPRWDARVHGRKARELAGYILELGQHWGSIPTVADVDEAVRAATKRYLDQSDEMVVTAQHSFDFFVARFQSFVPRKRP